MGPIASIDLGTHTARLLVARPTGNGSGFEPLVRERAIIRLAQGMDRDGGGVLSEEAVARALEALEQFRRLVRELDGEILQAVCTGVIRSAANRDAFLRRITRETGLQARSITGGEEAELTRKGVIASLGHPKGAFVIFDLGGGSTEFIYRKQAVAQDVSIRSLPLGALLLTEAFLQDDPPHEEALRTLTDHLDEVLSRELPGRDVFSGALQLIGTGGTVTTLAAMVHGIEAEAIAPERMNGLTLSRKALEGLFCRITQLPLVRRRELRGLDPRRADILPAGTLAVLRVMHYFEAVEMSVSLSDILEGLLIAYLEEEEYE